MPLPLLLGASFSSPHSFPSSTSSKELASCQERKLDILGLCPFSQALLPGCASHKPHSGRNFSIPMPSPSPRPWPHCSRVLTRQRGAVWPLYLKKKKVASTRPLLPLVVAISGEPSGGCLGHLPPGNGPGLPAQGLGQPIPFNPLPA